MDSRLTAVLCLGLLLGAVHALAQNQPCLESAPPSPPRAKTLLVFLPGDGGTTGCTAVGGCSNCKGGTVVSVSNAKCAQAVAIGDQSVANDNGWNDGGVP